MSQVLENLRRTFRSLALTGAARDLYLEGLNCEQLHVEERGLTYTITNPELFPQDARDSAIKTLPIVKKEIMRKGGCSHGGSTKTLLLVGGGLVAAYLLFKGSK